MATRKPATVEEILECLRKAPGISKGNAMQYHGALAYLRRELHTSSRKAAEWLTAATGQEPHEFELIGTSGNVIRYVSRNGIDVMLNNTVYTDEPDEMFWPQLTWQGEHVSKNADAGDREFVVLSKDLRAMCKKAAEFTKRKRMARERLRTEEKNGAEEHHGDALALFRGLLKMAGVALEDNILSASYRKSIAGDFTALNLHLSDGYIDAVGNVLAAHGIEPYPPVQIVTRKPSTTPDRAPEASDSV